jgi:hypothetical protein
MNFNEKYPNTELRALSWKQPFASLMLHGKIETRVWDAKYRGWVLICASKLAYKKEIVYDICGANYDLYMTIVEALKGDKTAGIAGKAIAIGKLVDSHPMRPDEQAKAFVAHRDGLFSHVYEDVQLISPIAWQGSQGWRTIPDDFKFMINII